MHTNRRQGPGRYATANTVLRNTPNCYKTTENEQKYLSLTKRGEAESNLGQSKNFEGSGIVFFFPLSIKSVQSGVS